MLTDAHRRKWRSFAGGHIRTIRGGARKQAVVGSGVLPNIIGKSVVFVNRPPLLRAAHGAPANTACRHS